jgi:aerobic carbon-monoxide dehydrogenase small subunit
MRTEFILNGKPVKADISPDLRLSELLRDQYSLLGTKSGCMMGVCGSCLVFIDGVLTASCLVPAFSIDKSDIVTIEGIIRRKDFEDIENGFLKAGMNPCGYCAAGKVMVTQAYLVQQINGNNFSPKDFIEGVKCRCTSIVNFKLAIQYAVEFRKRRNNAG